LSNLQETGRWNVGESLSAVLFGAMPDGRSRDLGRRGLSRAGAAVEDREHPDDLKDKKKFFIDA